MMIGTLQDYISAKERVTETVKQKLWRKYLHFFDLQNEKTSWQIFFAWIFGCATLATFALIHLIHIH